MSLRSIRDQAAIEDAMFPEDAARERERIRKAWQEHESRALAGSPSAPQGKESECPSI